MENNVNITSSAELLKEIQFQELKSSQNLWGAVLGGLLGAVVGAIAWAIITAVTKYQIGWMAIGIGFLTGFMVKKLGCGFEKHFGYIGAICSFLGCFAGNLFAVLIVVSNQENFPLIDLLRLLNFDILVSIIKDTFRPMDILFYALAIYEGYRFSLLTRAEVIEKLNHITAAKTI